MNTDADVGTEIPMSPEKQPCQSCGMPIESGPHCNYCVDENGNLQQFDERFERMTQWVKSRNPELPAADVEAQTLTYMSTMPSWRDHPRVVAHVAKST